MAEQSNGTTAAAPGGDALRQLIVRGQYIKDLSFESPRSPQILLQQTQPPEISVNVDVKAQALGSDTFEVVVSLQADAKSAGDTIFVIELAYGGVVSLVNTPEEDVGPALLVETPRLLFPYARAIFSQVTRDGGFPPFLLNPIDFADLYRRQLAAAQAGSGGPIPV